MSAADLTARIDAARSRHQEARNQLNEVSGAFKGISIGMELASRQLSLSNARDVLRLTRPVDPQGIERLKLGVNRADLEAALRTNGWTQKLLINPKDRKPNGQPIVNGKPTISHIWQSPTGDESIRLTPKPDSIGVRGYNGPWGGAGGHWIQQLPYEHALDIKANTSPAGTNNVYPNKAPETHFQVRPGSRVSGVVGALDNAPIRLAGRALGPIGLIFDAYSLFQAHEADGGRFGEESKATLGGAVGGIAGGALAGAAIGSIFPGVGTVIGGVVGGILGSIIGEGIGEAL